MMNARRLRALLLSRVPALALNVESSSDHSCLSPSGTAKPMPRTPRIGRLSDRAYRAEGARPGLLAARRLTGHGQHGRRLAADPVRAQQGADRRRNRLYYMAMPEASSPPSGCPMYAAKKPAAAAQPPSACPMHKKPDGDLNLVCRAAAIAACLQASAAGAP